MIFEDSKHWQGGGGGPYPAPKAPMICPASQSSERLIQWLQTRMTNSDFYLTRGSFFRLRELWGLIQNDPRSWGGGGQQGRKGLQAHRPESLWGQADIVL